MTIKDELNPAREILFDFVEGQGYLTGVDPPDHLASVTFKAVVQSLQQPAVIFRPEPEPQHAGDQGDEEEGGTKVSIGPESEPSRYEKSGNSHARDRRERG